AHVRGGVRHEDEVDRLAEELGRGEAIVVLGANADADPADRRRDHVRPDLTPEEIGFGASWYLLADPSGFLARGCGEHERIVEIRAGGLEKARGEPDMESP